MSSSRYMAVNRIREGSRRHPAERLPASEIVDYRSMELQRTKSPDRGPANGTRKLVLMLLIAAGLVGCAGAALGPVDHECHPNPTRSYGSGCEDYP